MIRNFDIDYVFSVYERLKKYLIRIMKKDNLIYVWNRKIKQPVRFADFYDWYRACNSNYINIKPGWIKVTIDELKKENW